MTAKLYLTHTAEHWNATCQATIPAHWEGYCDALTFTGNTELTGEPVRFDGFSRDEVVSDVVAELKSRGLTGTLEVINQ